MGALDQRAERGHTLNQPYQDAQGHWCCPRCQGAHFKSFHSVLGHMRACTVAGMVKPLPAQAARSFGMVSGGGYAPQHSEAPAWFVAEMSRMNSRIDEIHRAQTNHLAHARVQLAGTAGVGPAAQNTILGFDSKTVLLIVGVLVGGALLWAAMRDENAGLRIRRAGDGAAALGKIATAGKTLKGLMG